MLHRQNKNVFDVFGCYGFRSYYSERVTKKKRFPTYFLTLPTVFDRYRCIKMRSKRQHRVQEALERIIQQDAEIEEVVSEPEDDSDGIQVKRIQRTSLPRCFLHFLLSVSFLRGKGFLRKRVKYLCEISKGPKRT